MKGATLNKTSKMKKRKMLVQFVAKNVRVKNQDLRRDYPISCLAEIELQYLEKKVSPQLYGTLVQYLEAFHGDMQLEMVEDMVVFADEGLIHTTGCPSADAVLDLCYMWIANDLGMVKQGYKSLFK